MSFRFFNKSLDDIKGPRLGATARRSTRKKSKRAVVDFITAARDRMRRGDTKKFITTVSRDDGVGADADVWKHDKFSAQALDGGKHTKRQNAEDSHETMRNIEEEKERDESNRDSSVQNVEDGTAEGVSGTVPRSQSEIPAGGAAVIVNNIAADIEADDIQELFEAIGPVVQVKMYKDANDESTGMAKVILLQKRDARAAVKEYNGRLLDRRRLELVLQEPPAPKKKKKRKISTSDDDGIPVKIKMSAATGTKFKIKFDDEETLSKLAPKGNRTVTITGNGKMKIRMGNDKVAAQQQTVKRIITIDVDAKGAPKNEGKEKTDENGRWLKNDDVAKINNNSGRNRNMRLTKDGFEQRGRGMMKFGTMRADRIAAGRKSHTGFGAQRRGRERPRMRSAKGDSRGTGQHRGGRKEKSGNSRSMIQTKHRSKQETSPDDLDAKLKAFMGQKSSK